MINTVDSSSSKKSGVIYHNDFKLEEPNETTVYKIVKEYLIKNNLRGLRNKYGFCRCTVSTLMKCKQPFPDCITEEHGK